MKTPQEIAEVSKLVFTIDDWVFGHTLSVDKYELLSECLTPALIAAEQRGAEKERERWKAFADGKGEPRKVDTTRFDPAAPEREVGLPVFGDGTMWLCNEEFYTWQDGQVVEFFVFDGWPKWTNSGWVVEWGEGEVEVAKCYPTLAAALAAAAKGVQ